MILGTNNMDAFNIANNWSSSGRTRHMDVRLKFLRELKEANIIHVKHTSGETNEADMFTKNLARPLFERHGKQFVGEDSYMASS